MWSGRLPQVHWTLIAGRGAPPVTFRMLRQVSCRSRACLPGVDLSAWMAAKTTHNRKNQNLFSKTSAPTVWPKWITEMAMKANEIQSHGGTDIKLIAASNGVKKLGRKEGRTKQVGDVRLTWKATARIPDMPPVSTRWICPRERVSHYIVTRTQRFSMW
jgi:hypothetical protein